MTLEKTANFFKDVRTIWVGMVFFMSSISGAFVWAGNQQWVTKTAFNHSQRVVIIQQINREISDLKTRLIYEQDPNKKNMIEALIINKQTQIKNIKEEK